MCNLVKTPVNRKVPGIATNILRNIILIHGNLYYLRLLSNSSLAKTCFLREKGFLAPLGFPRSHRWSSVHKKDRLTANQRASIWTTKLEIEANAVIYTHTYMHIYIQDSSKADGIGHRRPSLVTYATWISLLRSVVASQRLYGSLLEGLENKCRTSDLTVI